MNENLRAFIQISLKFVPGGPFDNKLASVQVMAWRRSGNKPLPEPAMTQFSDAALVGDALRAEQNWSAFCR